MVYVYILYGLLFPLILNLLMKNLLNNFFIKLLYIILIIVNSLIIFKLVNKKLKYNQNQVIDIKYIKEQIDKTNGYHKYIELDNLFILINEFGIFEFYFLNEKGILNGNINDKYFYLNDKNIINPYIKIKDAYYYFIITSNITFKVKGIWLTTKRNIGEVILNKQKKKKYTAKQIDKLFDEMSNNVKKSNKTCNN